MTTRTAGVHRQPRTERSGRSPAPGSTSRETEAVRLAYEQQPGPGLAIINPLSFGVTLQGLTEADGQRAFLDAMRAGYSLVTFDQRGAGGSAGAGVPHDWEQRGADLWSVADAAGIERAVLYGVADGGYTIAHAAAQQPQRVLGLIFNFVPPAFAGEDGLPPADALAMLRGFGIPEQDAEALARAWLAEATPEVTDAYRRLLAGANLGSFPRLPQRALVIEPQRRTLFRGWGDALVALLPDARVVRPARGIQTLGAMHAFLAELIADVGRQASTLSPALSATVESSERSVGELRRIIVAVDDDLASGRAVELACRLGEAQQARIILLHVVEVPHACPLDQPPPEAVARGERALRVGRAIAERHGRVSCEALLVNGRSAAGSLVKLAEDRSADLIVLADPGDPARGESRIVSEVLRRVPGKVLVDRGGAA